MVQQKTPPLGLYRGLNQSEIVKGGPPLWLAVVQIFLYVCVRLKMRVLLQSEREVSSRDARSSFSEFDLFSECLTVTPGFCDRWIYRKIMQTPLFSKLLQILLLDASCDVIAMRIQSKKGCFSVQKNGMNSFAFSSCTIYKSYIGQTNRKRNKSALIVWATDRLFARTGAAGCSRSRDTVIHSAGRYSEESSRISRRIHNISVRSCEKHSNSAQNYVKATDIRTNSTDVENRRNVIQ